LLRNRGKYNLENIRGGYHGYKWWCTSWVGIWYIFIVKHTHTISVVKHVFHTLSWFIPHTACKLKRACSTCTQSHDPHIKLCYPGDAASKYRMWRVAAPCLLCIKFLYPVMLLLSRLYFRRKGPRCYDCLVYLIQKWPDIVRLEA
jgi:hypothetical protein